MADAIFDASDRATSKRLPPELQGKSPDEIAEYYQNREQILIERSRKAAPPPEKHPEPEEKIDIFGDPTGSINRVVERKVGQAADHVSSVISPAIINACRITLRDAHPDAVKFMAEIEAAMARMTPESQMNPGYWEVAYTNVKGRHTERLITEAVEADRTARNPVLKSSPKGTDPPPKRELSDQEISVAGKFELTPDEYRSYANRYDATDGVLPITIDNRKSTRKKVSA